MSIGDEAEETKQNESGMEKQVRFSGGMSRKKAEGENGDSEEQDTELRNLPS